MSPAQKVGERLTECSGVKGPTRRIGLDGQVAALPARANAAQAAKPPNVATKNAPISLVFTSAFSLFHAGCRPLEQ